MKFVKIFLRPNLILLLLLCSGCKRTEITLLNSLSNSGPNDAPATTTTINKRSLAVGETKVLALNQSNVAQVWGSNYEVSNGGYGQLGLGLSGNVVKNSPQPLDVATSYISFSSGETSSCGLTTDQRIKCWGTFAGDGSGQERSAPVFINDGGSKKYIDFEFGAYHGCAIQTSGALSCWGDGWDGKLGNQDASGATQDSPVSVDAGTMYVRVAAGRNHTCAITTLGSLRCWGTNSSGQLGDGTTTSPRLAAVTVDAANTYSSVATGDDTTCAITTTGVLKCWGSNGSGQVGDNSTVQKNSPVVIDNGTTYSQVSVGGVFFMHTCGITTAGVLKCWGDNSKGQLGNNSTVRSLVPITIDAGVTYKDVSVYFGHSCGVTTAGILKCWGSNGSGELGLGNLISKSIPTVVGGGY